MRVDAISSSSITVGRGCLDTVPREHASGSFIFFWGGYQVSEPTEFVAAETVNAKLTPRTFVNTLPLSMAPVDSVTMDSRAIRPYPPGKLELDSDMHPGLSYLPSGTGTLSWVVRDRLGQTESTVIDFTDNGVTSVETGVTYRVRVRGVTSSGAYTSPDIVDSSGITGLSYAYNTSGWTVPTGTATLEWSVTSQRGGYDNWQSPTINTDSPAATPATATGAVTLPAMTASGAAAANISATGAVTLPSLTASGSVFQDLTSTGAAALPALTADGAAQLTLTSSGAVTLPALAADGAAGAILPPTAYYAVRRDTMTDDGSGNLATVPDQSGNGFSTAISGTLTLDSDGIQMPGTGLDRIQPDSSIYLNPSFIIIRAYFDPSDTQGVIMGGANSTSVALGAFESGSTSTTLNTNVGTIDYIEVGGTQYVDGVDTRGDLFTALTTGSPVTVIIKRSAGGTPRPVPAVLQVRAGSSRQATSLARSTFTTAASYRQRM